VKQQKDKEDEIERKPNSTFFSDMTIKTSERNNLEWSQLYKFVEEGDFIEENKSNENDLLTSEDLAFIRLLLDQPYYLL
jgi:hypothetical protein